MHLSRLLTVAALNTAVRMTVNAIAGIGAQELARIPNIEAREALRAIGQARPDGGIYVDVDDDHWWEWMHKWRPDKTITREKMNVWIERGKEITQSWIEAEKEELRANSGIIGRVRSYVAARWSKLLHGRVAEPVFIERAQQPACFQRIRPGIVLRRPRAAC